MDRFMTQDRIASGKLPDIDQDLPHRDLLVDPQDPAKGWLTDRFGDCVAQISTDMTIKVKSAVLDVHRVLSPDRRVPEDVARLAHNFSQAPQGISDRDHVLGYDNNGEWVAGAIEWDENLIAYTRAHPAEWEIVQKLLGILSGKGRHACAFVIADEPIHTFIPTMTLNGFKVTQPSAAQVESSGGLKMDFLVVNSLKDIGIAIKLLQERSGDTSQPWASAYPYFDALKIVDPEEQREAIRQIEQKVGGKCPRMNINGKQVPLIRVIPHKGGYVDIWDLPEDQPVFRDICESDTVSVFQFGTPGAQKWLRHFNHVRSHADDAGEIHKALDSIEALAAFTALDRPGRWTRTSPIPPPVTSTTCSSSSRGAPAARRPWATSRSSTSCSRRRTASSSTRSSFSAPSRRSARPPASRRTTSRPRISKKQMKEVMDKPDLHARRRRDHRPRGRRTALVSDGDVRPVRLQQEPRRLLRRDRLRLRVAEAPLPAGVVDRGATSRREEGTRREVLAPLRSPDRHAGHLAEQRHLRHRQRADPGAAEPAPGHGAEGDGRGHGTLRQAPDVH
jgi:hypothetical protein